MAGRQATSSAPGALPGLSVGALGDGVLRVVEVICALINPAGAKAEPLIQVRAHTAGVGGLPLWACWFCPASCQPPAVLWLSPTLLGIRPQRVWWHALRAPGKLHRKLVVDGH